MKRWLALIFVGGLLPGRVAAQISTDTCCGRWGQLRPRAATAAPVVALPTCYPPVLAVPEPLPYDPGQPTLPVFRWKSGAPIYATDEQFIFRLVALPSGQVLLERKVAGRQLEWPPSLKLPGATTGLQYTVQASRRDQEGQQCFSTATQGTVQLPKKAEAAPYK